MHIRKSTTNDIYLNWNWALYFKSICPFRKRDLQRSVYTIVAKKQKSAIIHHLNTAHAEKCKKKLRKKFGLVQKCYEQRWRLRLSKLQNNATVHTNTTLTYTVHILAYQCEMHLLLRYFMFFILMFSAEIQMTDWVWLTVIEND